MTSYVSWIQLDMPAPAPTVVGSMSVQEDADTFAASGVQVGSMSAVEDGDVFAASGTGPYQAFVSWVQLDVPAPLSYLQGVVSAQEDTDVFAATGVVEADITGGWDFPELTARMVATEEPDDFYAEGVTGPSGDLFATEDGDIFAATGISNTTGTLVVVEASDTFAASGFLGPRPVLRVTAHARTRRITRH